MALSFDEALSIVDDYLINPSKYVFPFVIKEKNNRERTIITYCNNSDGANLREIHTYIKDHISPFYSSSKHSFAYKKDNNCLLSTKDHLSSTFFIKLDISSFFETINEELFLKHYPNLFENYGRKKRMKKLLKSVFYEGHLSLGYVSSPVISDIYLSKFDATIEKYIKNRKELHYSRYCDDILISSSGNNWTDLDMLFEVIKNELNEYSLVINQKKTQKVELNNEHHNSICYLGLNISKSDKGKKNKITISKNFILFTLELLSKYYNNEESDNPFLRNKILSRVAYIKNNALPSYKKFLRKHLNRFDKEYVGI